MRALIGQSFSRIHWESCPKLVPKTPKGIARGEKHLAPFPGRAYLHSGGVQQVEGKAD
jgi:hypothetical protein